MTKNSLQIISQTFFIYLNIKFPKLKQWKVDSINELLFGMYSMILKDLENLDSNVKLVRHYIEAPLDSGNDDAPSVVLSLERIDTRSEFVLSCEGELITTWHENNNKELN